MSALDRVIAIAYALAGLVAALVTTAVLGGQTWPARLYTALKEQPGFLETALALLAISALAGMRIIWAGLKPAKKQAVVQEGSLGQIRITLEAIESLVEKIALDQRGIKEARSTVKTIPQGIGIRVKAVVAPDVSIPQLSGNLQNVIADRVLQVTGIEVKDIRIVVSNISAQKLRVE
ncbi:MAG TPA: alkaline shock response membrane anchor protein AmaP [Desulfotomaculum sp.]|nr:alkaline shock response membrane anchor protein AmaP [Desulfotomaculum sp.]